MSCSRIRPALAPRPPRRFLLLWLVLVLPLWCVGCSDDDPEAPKPENITRTWQMTVCEYRHETNDALHVDLVADGWVIVLTINDNGAFRYAWTQPGGSEEYYDGTWTIDGDTVSLRRTGFAFSWDFTTVVQESNLTMRGAHVEYDFDDDGTGEPAIWNLTGRT